jgi:hypothetical protein
MLDEDELTEFGEFCEKHDIPVFDRNWAFGHWNVDRARFEKEYESWHRAEQSGYRRRGANRKNQF